MTKLFQRITLNASPFWGWIFILLLANGRPIFAAGDELDSKELGGKTVASVTPAPCKRDIWLIDTHAIDRCDCDLGAARFLRLEGNCEWVTESEASFHSTNDPNLPVNFFIPGYLATVSLCVEHGWALHQALEKQAQCRGMECAPIRLVIWTWPSERHGLGIVRDARDKASRADHEALLLAKVLGSFPVDAKVNLVGYSFGARIATGAADILAGGHCGACTFESASGGPRLNGTLLAAGVDSEWLSVCQPHSLAPSRFEKLLLINNSTDRVLKRFRLLDRSTKPKALGVVGLLMPNVSDSTHIQQWEVSQLVGRSHNFQRYAQSPEIMSAIAPYAFFLEQ